ncbi:ribonuclease Z [Vairimorpha necatrix]|uniref:ribonuclease Z n=1 Tax=Vairimorpha necatrix TaxID=6039 RepID=A0AAX4JCF8_9MICR
MICSLKCLSTKSGKSILLILEKKTYVFNIFEGFQRYCIEANISLKFITTVFIPNREGIPPLCGLYLTLRDMNVNSLNIVCSEDVENLIKKAFSFCPPNSLKILFIRDFYDDEFITVTDQYILQIKKFRGKFKIENIPENIPKKFYKELVLGKKITVEGQTYEGSDFLEPSINFKKIFILYNGKLKIEEGSKVLCLRMSDYKRLKSEDTWYVCGSAGIDFVSQYNLLRGLRDISKDYHLPRLLKQRQKIRRTRQVNKKLTYDILEPCRFFKYLQSTDCFTYKKEALGFVLNRGVRNVPLVNYQDSDNFLTTDENFALILGSGCAIPSKYRNVTGIFVFIENKGFLLDCGEDTVNQLLRLKGSQCLLDSLDVIFISHSHGDHNLGLINLLAKLNHKVILIAPQCIIDFVSSFCENVVTFATNKAKELEYEHGVSSFNFPDDLEINVCGCVHNLDSCSVSIKYKNVKFSYSGDTRPSELFACMAFNSDLMIHESTFEDDNLDKALKTKHSTLGEAYYIFKKSQSKELLLTHFSQRYSKNFMANNLGIPCHDFYKYRIGKSEYKDKDINEYLKNLQ